MNRFKTPLLIALAGALLITSAPDAQARDRGERPAFGDLDANGDGRLTRDELTAFGRARGAERFAAADVNGDGALTRDEIEAGVDARASERLDRIMARDADGDGRLTPDELVGDDPRRGGRFFDRADADGDGALSEAEWETMAQRRGRR
ncbi:MAG: calcium-binding protein [Pseudomonadota bacterium]